MPTAAIYRGYDRAALDAQYNNSARVPEAGAIIAGWTERSARARARPGVRLDVAYGPGPAETVDVFPAATPGAPIHLFFHGGYWQMLGKADFAFLGEAFVPAGVCLAVVDYPLCPSVTLTELVRQSRAAAAFCHRRAGDWGADGRRLTVSGHSAGGHLAALLLSTDWPTFGAGLPADLVEGAVAVSGLYDLEPIRLSYVNDKLGLDAAEAAALSPIRHLPARAGPLVLAVGGAESEEYLRQQADFAAAWTGHGLAANIVDMPGQDHFTILEAFADPTSPLNRAALELMGC